MKTKMEWSPRRRPKPSPAPPPLASICFTMWNAWKATTRPCSRLSAELDVSPICTSWSRYTSSLWNLICVNSCSSSALSPCFQVNTISLLILVIVVEPYMHAHRNTVVFVTLTSHTTHNCLLKSSTLLVSPCSSPFFNCIKGCFDSVTSFQKKPFRH